MFSLTAKFLWFVLPPLAWLFRKHLPFPIFRSEPVLLYFAVLISGTILYVGSIWIIDKEFEYAAMRFDLDGDGGFSDDEYTPAAKAALRDWTSDTGRSFAPLFAAPVTFLYVSLWFAILFLAGWLWPKVPIRIRYRET